MSILDNDIIAKIENSLNDRLSELEKEAAQLGLSTPVYISYLVELGKYLCSAPEHFAESFVLSHTSRSDNKLVTLPFIIRTNKTITNMPINEK